MKLPRFKYTYVVFYAFLGAPGSSIGNGQVCFTRHSKLSTEEDIVQLTNDIAKWSSNKGTTEAVVTNYKLLSVKVVWE